MGRWWSLLCWILMEKVKVTDYDKNYGSYYLTAEGSYARNKWVGRYYLKSDGKMAKNEWVDGGRYYVESDGKMAKDKWVG